MSLTLPKESAQDLAPPPSDNLRWVREHRERRKALNGMKLGDAVDALHQAVGVAADNSDLVSSRLVGTSKEETLIKVIDYFKARGIVADDQRPKVDQPEVT